MSCPTELAPRTVLILPSPSFVTWRISPKSTKHAKHAQVYKSPLGIATRRSNHDFTGPPVHATTWPPCAPALVSGRRGEPEADAHDLPDLRAVVLLSSGFAKRSAVGRLKDRTNLMRLTSKDSPVNPCGSQAALVTISTSSFLTPVEEPLTATAKLREKQGWSS